MHAPSIIAKGRALAALAVVITLAGAGAFLVAPEATVRGLPFILLLLACPLMMLFVMGSMHQMPAVRGTRSRSGRERRRADRRCQRAGEPRDETPPPPPHRENPGGGSSSGCAATSARICASVRVQS